MFGIGPSEMILIAIVGLLLFGRRLPEIARSVGKSVVELKRGLREIEHEAAAVDRMTDAAVRDAEMRLKQDGATKSGEPAEKPKTTSAALHDDRHG